VTLFAASRRISTGFFLLVAAKAKRDVRILAGATLAGAAKNQAQSGSALSGLCIRAGLGGGRSGFLSNKLRRVWQKTRIFSGWNRSAPNRY
jgi:hypothetical protein